MNILELTDINNAYATGDCHGEFMSLTHAVKEYDLHDACIIVCGDIGIGFEKKEYYNQTFAKMTKVLSPRNVHLVLFRGNHDDPKYFTGHAFRHKFIHVVPDYTVVKFDSMNVLCIGGATSVDRVLRIAENKKERILYETHHAIVKDGDYVKSYYWPDETPIFNADALDEIKENMQIHAVCTHTCPTFCQPLTKHSLKWWLSADKNLKDDLKKEREVFDKVFDRLEADGHPVSAWFYGHYHFHNSEQVNNVKFTLLDMSRNGRVDMVEIMKQNNI